MKRLAEMNQDEIQNILSQNGADAAAIERLARISRDMCELEWKLARRGASTAPVAPSEPAD